MLVFDQIKKIINDLEETEYRIIFWNSNKNCQEPFKAGIYRLPFIVKKSTLDQAFMYIKAYINNFCLTFPHLAFDSIPDEWISKADFNKIYFITDGEMGYSYIGLVEKNSLKTALGESIKKLFDKFNNIQLNIITVEPKIMDFTQIETIQKAAGCDVYNVIMEKKLTNYITKFISYTPNNLEGFTHISKNIPPAGCIAFGDKYFSETRTNEFIKYLSDLIFKTEGDDNLLQIVQNLSATISGLTKHKPRRVSQDIIKTFCDLFSETTLDKMFVKFILTEAVEKENAGMANIFAVYREQLQDLYKQASNLLKKNVKDAIGIGELFLTLPVNDRIVTGHFRLIDKNITMDKIVYPQSGTMVNNILLPIIPFDYSGSSLMNEQCLRQWVRVQIHKLYNVNTLEDIVIYIVLAITLRAVCSDIDELIKDAYRYLSILMLKKKRLNSDTTELERLENGDLPIPNSGKIESFYIFMETVNQKLGLHLQPMTLWYAMCLATKNSKLINKQLIHCRESIEKDFNDIDPQKLLTEIKNIITPITAYNIPFENILDYNCLITMEDTSNTGGYRFLPHKSIMNTVCCPVYVLSNEGYRQLILNHETSVCPICYTKLSETDFQKTDKKPELENLIFFPEETVNIFGKDLPCVKPAKPNIVSSQTIATKSFVNVNTFSTNTLNKKGTLVIMKGTVGAGKSTYGKLIKEKIESLGGHCFVEGTDKYCKSGVPISEAVRRIKEEFTKINDLDNNKLLVVVIDTCGEKVNNNDIFGIDFTGWKKVNVWPNFDRSKMEEYLAWTLRNVLQRGKPDADSNHYLNPIDAGINTCVDVHKRKARALLGKKIPNLFTMTPRTKEEAIQLINNRANSYQKILDTDHPIEKEISTIIENKIIG